MRKFLFMLILWTGSNYVGKSQTIDTLCFPVHTVQKLLIDAKQKKLADSLNAVLRSDISLLQAKITLLNEKDTNNSQIQKAYQIQVDALNKEVKKWKRKEKLTGIGGIALAAIITGLFVFK